MMVMTLLLRRRRNVQWDRQHSNAFCDRLKVFNTMYNADAAAVCTTAFGLNDPIIAKFSYQTVTIDEVQTVTWDILSMILYAKWEVRLVLIGDLQQSGPYRAMISNEDNEATPVGNQKFSFQKVFVHSILEDLLSRGWPKFDMTTNMRSVPEIVHFLNKMFYNGRLFRNCWPKAVGPVKLLLFISLNLLWNKTYRLSNPHGQR